MRCFDIIGAPFNRLGHITTKKNTINPIRKSDRNKWNGLTEWINIRNKRWKALCVKIVEESLLKEQFNYEIQYRI